MSDLERRIEALEELAIEEFARIWNCWPPSGRGSGGAFNFEMFESWKVSMRQSLQQKRSRPAERRQYIIDRADCVDTFTAIPRMIDKGNGTFEIELTDIEDWKRIPKGEVK